MPPSKKELMLAVLVMLAVPLLGEVALRVTRTQFEPQLYTASRERGWTLRPGASGVVSTENTQFVQINSRGFRDQERSYDKPPNTVRIAILGNSWTEALQVPLDKTYPRYWNTSSRGAPVFWVSTWRFSILALQVIRLRRNCSLFSRKPGSTIRIKFWVRFTRRGMLPITCAN